MADVVLADWSVTDGSNTDIDGHDIAEDCDPAGINNAMRGMVGAIARLVHAQTGEKTTTGSANAQALTTGMSLAALTNAFVVFEAGYSNTGAATLAVDGLTAKNIKVTGNAGLIDPWPNAIRAGGIYSAAYDGTQWVLLNPSPGNQDLHFLLRGTVANGTYTLILKSARKRKITSITTKGGAGTATFTFQIEGTPLGGTANAVSTSEQSQAHSSANELDVAETLTVVVTSASSCTNVAVSIEYEDS